MTYALAEALGLESEGEETVRLSMLHIKASLAKPEVKYIRAFGSHNTRHWRLCVLSVYIRRLVRPGCVLLHSIEIAIVFDQLAAETADDWY